MMEIAWITLDWRVEPGDDGWVNIYDGGHNESLHKAAWRIGNLIKTVTGKIHLVGTVNRERGVCGCCGINLSEAVAYATPVPELAELVEASED
jgi:hypothetical protein